MKLLLIELILSILYLDIHGKSKYNVIKLFLIVTFFFLLTFVILSALPLQFIYNFLTIALMK